MAIYLSPDKIENWNGVIVKQYFLNKHNDNNILLPIDKLINVSSITIHNTEWIKVNNATTPAEQYTRATINGNMKGTIVHFYVDDVCAWWNMPLDMVTWHSGDGVKGKTGNNTSISIECIMDKTNSSYNQKSMDNAAKLAAYLLNKYNLDVEKGLVTHTYWLNKKANKEGVKYNLCTTPPNIFAKTCPYYIIKGKGWNYFEDITEKYLKEIDENTSKAEIYRVRTAWSAHKSQIGAFSNLKSAKELADFNRGYKVYDSTGKMIYQPKQYYGKYITTHNKVACKKIPTRKADTIEWAKKDVEVIVYLGTNTKASNGTIWVKCIYKNDDVWLPLKYLRKE